MCALCTCSSNTLTQCNCALQAWSNAQHEYGKRTTSLIKNVNTTTGGMESTRTAPQHCPHGLNEEPEDEWRGAFVPVMDRTGSTMIEDQEG
mmetsp:Transcript_4323/g.13959  ORF Transcript_4323/g.13959 Transcript_4323/m.13959 type:complete len:91 (-) Transcript_4323:1552-1824(-)|eukprot:scaffold169808_cov35-Tisochrysis_lutea.AAC.3